MEFREGPRIGYEWEKWLWVAALAFQSAPRHLRPRDRHLGWSAEQRRANLRLVAYNTRYLIMPWVQVRHLLAETRGQRAFLTA